MTRVLEVLEVRALLPLDSIEGKVRATYYLTTCFLVASFIVTFSGALAAKIRNIVGSSKKKGKNSYL